jgi:hypothetical protein
VSSPNAPLPPPLSAVGRSGSHCRAHTIDTLTGDANEKAGNQTNPPSLLEGHKKLDRTLCAHDGDICGAEQQPAAVMATNINR